MGGHDAAQRQSLVLRLARAITSRHDLDDVLSETLRVLRPLVAFAAGSIQLLDDEGWIRVASADPVPPAHLMSQRVPLATSVAGRVILTEQAVYLPDIDTETLPLQRRKAVAADARSYLAVPLVADGAAIGLFQIDSPKPHAWTDEERELLMAVAPVVAAAIQNARAHARATAARTAAAAANRRLQEARAVVTALRVAHVRADSDEIERLVGRLENVLGDVADGPHGLRMPKPRATEPRVTEPLTQPRLAAG